MKNKILFFLIGLLAGIILVSLSPLRGVHLSNLMSNVLDDCTDEQEALTNAQNALTNNQEQLALLPSAETLAQQLTEIDGQISANTTQIDTIQKEIVALQDQLKKAGYDSPETFEKVLTRKQEELASRKKQNNNLENEYLRLSQIRPATSQIQQKMNALRTQINKNKTAIASLTNFIKTMENQKITLVDPLKSRLAQLRTLQTTRSRLQNDRTAIHNQSAQRSVLENEQPQLQSNVGNAQQALDACQGGDDDAVCGNEFIEQNEQCDDGNYIPSDGCDQCQFACNESTLPSAGVSYTLCPTSGYIEIENMNETSYVEVPLCAGGMAWYSKPCEYTLGSCGDGNRDNNEMCDDGNTTDGDGCSATCTLENNEPVCGNGIIEPGEECEDDTDVPEGFICLNCQKAEVQKP